MRDERSKIRELLGLENMTEEQLRSEIKRAPEDHTFLKMAILMSGRSHDAQTGNGCVLVKNKTVLSTGYNGFIRGIDDSVLPNVRPHKYPYMMHAEHNAILNCARNGIPTLGATSYQTGVPCNNCLQFMWQAGIEEIIYTDHSENVMVDEEADRIREALLGLINPTRIEYESFELPYPKEVTTVRLRIKFIPKNDVLANENVDKKDH